MKPRPPQVYVQCDAGTAHSRRILEGIADYAHSLPQPWLLRWGSELPSLAQLREVGYSGVVVFLAPPARVTELRDSELALVRVGTATSAAGVTHVIPDNNAIGALAATHFLEQHYCDFAFVGCETHGYSRERLRGFQEGLRGRRLTTFSVDERAEELLPGFLAKLPIRTAIFAANDVFARRVAETLEKLEVRIPEECSLLGVDNDTLISLSTSVALSSIDPASMQVGRQAAAMLSRLMSGVPDMGETERVPPVGVVLRASSDHLASSDELVSRAVRMIRLESCNGLTVAQLCTRLGIGRRVFERRFRAVLGQTLEAEMRQARITRAKELLSSTTWSVERIAEQSGFEDPFYFSSAFRKVTGSSPRAWRMAVARLK